ncbi:molybdenum cofactor guanylyltransferase [Lusitaniella coriacea]|uniref:molybdenum cofactor guanylyltransferase n=1 Tax=Lusitaniella coriacea TaxID=1983105 RepID=UPI003CED4B27
MTDRAPSQTNTLIALILAGGQSSRMGEDKASMLWDGIPLLQRVCNAATCCDSIYILTPWRDRYRPILNSEYTFLDESNPGQGALMAFAQGLEQIAQNPDWILLLACDLPQLDSKGLQRWIEQLNDVPPDTLAAVPFHNEFWEPLCGFYRPGARESLQDFIAGGGRSFQKWLSHLPAQPLTVSEEQRSMLLNCNSPQDLSRMPD